MRFWRALILGIVIGLVSLPIGAGAQQAETLDADRRILVLLRQVPPHYRGGAAYGASYGDLMGRAARDRLGRRIAKDHRLQFLGNWPMPLVGLDCFIMAVPEGESIDAAIQRVKQDDDVEWSQPVNLYETLNEGAPDGDPLAAVAPATRQWHLEELHGLSTGNRVSVAIIDTRVESDHPDLMGQVVVSRDFGTTPASGSESHGTAIAGVIAAKANNGIGSRGVAPRARLMALRACHQRPDDRSAVCDSLSLAKALHYAIEQKADVINLSLGGPSDPLLARLLDAGITRGATVVAAANVRASGGGFPASHPGVIAVSSVPFTNAPRGVVAAPGQDVPTTLPGGRWHLVNGSSYAAAHVSGLMALIREGRDRHAAPASLVLLPDSGGLVDARSSLRGQRRVGSPKS